MSLEPVDTGRRMPSISPIMTSMGTGAVTPPFNPNGSIPGVTPGVTGTLPTIQPGQPGAPITRPSFLQAFLANLGPALAGGLAQSGDPRFPFGTGLPGALQGIATADQLRRQNANEQRNQARQDVLAQNQLATGASQRAYTTAETSRLNAITPYDIQDRQLQQDVFMANLKFFADPSNLNSAVADATKNLGKLSAPEQSRLDSAVKEAQISKKFDPVNAAVKDISDGRIATQRGLDTAMKGNLYYQAAGGNPQAQKALQLETGQKIAAARAANAGAPSALAGVDPKLIGPASAAYDKAGQEYATAYQSAQNMGDFIQAAKSGNKSAVKIVPLQGALEITTAQGVHRINRTEVDQFGGAGSAYDRLAGKVGGVLTGKDITDDVLNDMDSLQKIVSRNAARLHANKVSVINKSYGSHFQPMDFSKETDSTDPGGLFH